MAHRREHLRAATRRARRLVPPRLARRLELRLANIEVLLLLLQGLVLVLLVVPVVVRLAGLVGALRLARPEARLVVRIEAVVVVLVEVLVEVR